MMWTVISSQQTEPYRPFWHHLTWPCLLNWLEIFCCRLKALVNFFKMSNDAQRKLMKLQGSRTLFCCWVEVPWDWNIFIFGIILCLKISMQLDIYCRGFISVLWISILSPKSTGFFLSRMPVKSIIMNVIMIFH